MKNPQTAGYVMVVALLVTSCTGSEGPSASSEQAGSGGPTGAGGQSGMGGGDGNPAKPPVVEEDIGGFEADNAWVFSDKAIHMIEITLTDASVAALNADAYTSVVGDISINGEELSDVGVRLRGKIGSFRTLDGKPKLKIKFNEYNKKQRFYGLEELALNNSVVDCSYLKEPLAYRIFELAKLPAQRIGFARVLINGAEYGFYVLVEVPDDRFLKRAYKNPDGNLYDGKYIWYGGFNYQLLDFNTGVDDLFSLEEGAATGNAEIKAVSSATAKWAGTGQFEAGLAPLVEWDQVHRYLAAEQWVGSNDGYALNTNNYRVYFDPSDGLARFLSWDHDYAFLVDSQWGKSWSSPQGQIAAQCFADKDCVAGQKVAVQSLLSAIDPAALTAWFDPLDALTYEAALSDARRECSPDQIAPARQALRGWISAQNGQMSAFWGL